MNDALGGGAAPWVDATLGRVSLTSDDVAGLTKSYVLTAVRERLTSAERAGR